MRSAYLRHAFEKSNLFLVSRGQIARASVRGRRRGLHHCEDRIRHVIRAGDVSERLAIAFDWSERRLFLARRGRPVRTSGGWYTELGCRRGVRSVPLPAHRKARRSQLQEERFESRVAGTINPTFRRCSSRAVLPQMPIDYAQTHSAAWSLHW